MKTKHCILMLVDALSYRIVSEQFEQHKLPNLEKLIMTGGHVRPCTSVFPSITPAATCSNIDQVIYKLDDHQWRVETANRGTLSFKYGGDTDSPKARDHYGNHWVIEGDLASIDAERNDQGIIAYGVYPNALERIAAAFVANSSPIWVTARPGAEFVSIARPLVMQSNCSVNVRRSSWRYTNVSENVAFRKNFIRLDSKISL